MKKIVIVLFAFLVVYCGITENEEKGSLTGKVKIKSVRSGEQGEYLGDIFLPSDDIINVGPDLQLRLDSIAIDGIEVVLLKAVDNSIVHYVLPEPDGEFHFLNIEPGSYKLFAKVHGVNVCSDTLSILQVAGDVIAPEDLIIPEKRNTSTDYLLFSNYPNPFNPTTKIEFGLQTAVHVKIEIFTILGQSVRTLVDKQYEAGFWNEVWDAKDDSGNLVDTGIYFIVCEFDSYLSFTNCLFVKL